MFNYDNKISDVVTILRSQGFPTCLINSLEYTGDLLMCYLFIKLDSNSRNGIGELKGTFLFTFGFVLRTVSTENVQKYLELFP